MGIEAGDTLEFDKAESSSFDDVGSVPALVEQLGIERLEKVHSNLKIPMQKREIQVLEQVRGEETTFTFNIRLAHRSGG